MSVREGYDLWAETYETTPNPVVYTDSQVTIPELAPQPGERILDAGCGTGRNLRAIAAAGAHPVGIDFSFGMIDFARRAQPDALLVQADLQSNLPFLEPRFDAVLCALIGEHLENLPFTFGEMHAALRPGGRMVFSVFHPDLAQAGSEANFDCNGEEIRLGAIKYRTEDYLQMIDEAGFRHMTAKVHKGDASLASVVPAAADLVDQNVILTIRAEAAGRES